MRIPHCFKFIAVIVFIACFAPFSKSQIVGGNCFLKGNYVEVGINTCGAYGSNALPPAGYHPTAPMTGLGFVADGDEDGWDVGTPLYCGDYFVPGSPVEGWALQIGGTTYYNTDQSCSSFNVPGSLSSYTYAGGVYTGVWEGSVAAHNLDITQTTTLPENKAYFVTRVLFCNTGLTDVNDVYWERNVDPDNDEPWSGDFTTDNTIVDNPPADDRALVTSTGLTYGCFLGIGSKDTASRVTYGNFATTAGTPINVYDGTGGYFLSGEEVADIANSISFHVGTIPPGECRCVAFAYVLSAADLDEALEATSSFDMTANGAAVASDGNVVVCAGDSLDLAVISIDTSLDWTWTSTGGAFAVDTGTEVHFFTSTNVDITATGIGGFCGDETRTIHILVDDTAHANAGPDKAICIGSSTTLNGSGGVTYEWIPATGLTDPGVATPLASPTATTTYVLTTFDGNGCPAFDSTKVTVNPLPIVSAGADVTLCPEGQIQLNASGATSYTWTPPDGLSCTDCPNPICTVNTTTTYTVTGTDDNGCVNTDDINVDVFSALDITVTADPVTIDIYQGQSSQLDASGAVSYVWVPSTGLSNPDIADPIAQPADTTTYYVTGTDADGCIDVDTITIDVIGQLIIGLPGAFSPGTGINNYWHPMYSGSGFLDSYVIYNRWGQVMYEGTAYTQGWDGKLNGNDQDVGTYVVVVKAHTTKGEQKLITGNFTLVR